MKRNDLCIQIISLENEIEMMQEEKVAQKFVRSSKRELKKLINKLGEMTERTNRLKDYAF